jgi:hypothetical protein
MIGTVDVAIPGIIGLVMSLWPRFFFVGSRATPTKTKLRRIRYIGLFLLLVALFNLVIKFLGQ